MLLDTGDSANTVWSGAVGSSLDLHLAEALRVVDDGATLAAPHFDVASVQVSEVDEGAVRQESSRKSRKFLFFHLPLINVRLGWVFPSFKQDGLRQTRSGLTQSM